MGPKSNTIQILWLLNPKINLEVKEAYPRHCFIQHIDHMVFIYFYLLIRRIKYQIQVQHIYKCHRNPKLYYFCKDKIYYCINFRIHPTYKSNSIFLVIGTSEAT